MIKIAAEDTILDEKSGGGVGAHGSVDPITGVCSASKAGANLRGEAIVLGGAGFIGRYAARTLAAAGWRVRGIGHGNWSLADWQRWGFADWHSADVNGETLLTYAGEPDLIVQCAGSGSVAFSMTHPVQDYQRSIDPTLAALEFVRVHAPACKVVLPSSAAVYGTVKRLPISVDTPLRPDSPYGVHKKIAEDLCRSYGRTFGISTAIVRLFSVYGVGLRKQLLWDACLKLSQGNSEFSGTGTERRDWLNVDDAATLLVAAAEHASPGCPVVNGGTSDTADIATVVGCLKAALGSATEVRFSGERRGGDPIDYQADITQALAWGWKPKHSLVAMLAEYAAWFRAGAE